MESKKRVVRKVKGKENESKTYQLAGSVVLVALGCALLIAGFVSPPKGEIHSSVLVAFGEILTFVGALCGIDYRYKSKV